jgi:hypothetical protein
MRNNKASTRTEKINALKGIMSGKVSINDLAEPKTYMWQKRIGQNYKPLFDDDLAKEMNEEEFRAFMNSREGKKEKHIVFMEQEGNEPIIDEE